MSEFGDRELAKKVGQLFVVGFSGATKEAPESVRRALANSEIGGVILFRRNVGDVDQVAALSADIHEAAKDAPAPPFVAVDQEGGRVVRLEAPLTPVPPMRSLGQAADLRDVARVSQMMAEEIRELGFNLNFAPVIDVDTNPDNPVIGDRAFSSDPERVARCGAGFMLGHHTAGVVPCVKHFPGHGDTIVDSHVDLPTIEHDRTRLDKIELYPFERAVAADAPMIMTAHVQIPALDPFYPATMSPMIIDGILRKEMGYDGVVVTDCLEMKAVADRFEIEEMVDRSLDAGVDLFLICHTEEKWKKAMRHLYERALDDDKVRARVEESAERVLSLKEELLGHWPRPWTGTDDYRQFLGNPDHLALVEPYRSDDSANDDDPTRAPQ
jgi:beta-N-acetylhexosaminidase